MSIHSKGRICVLDAIDVENQKIGIAPKCTEHRHVGRKNAFELCRSARFGKVIAFVASSATSEDNPAPAGCFVLAGGTIEYVHLRSRSKVNLKVVYALGEKLSKNLMKPFMRRTDYRVL